MLDVSIAELAIIFLIALVILGPERLPRVARTLGHWAGRARGAFNHLRDELDREAFNQDMQERFRGQLKEMGLDEESLRKEQEEILPPHKESSTRDSEDGSDRKQDGEDEDSGDEQKRDDRP